MATLKKVSLRDIAKAAGVSPALVSFVLNGKAEEYRVGEETAQKIKQIAIEMNYQPNLAARGLRAGKTKTIGLVVSDISNPFFAQLARVLEDEATKKGYSVLFASSDENAKKMACVISNLINKGVDGLIVVPCEHSENTIETLNNNGISLVLFDRYFPSINVSYVALDNYAASYKLTESLIKGGFKSPCIIAYDVKLIHMKERIRGYKEAMTNFGKKDTINIITFKQGMSRKMADRIIPQLLESGIDSFLFSTNMISLACLYAIKSYYNRNNKTANIGLACFDSNPVFDFYNSNILYIQQPIDFLVRKSLDILIENMSKGNIVQSVLAEGEFFESKKQ